MLAPCGGGPAPAPARETEAKVDAGLLLEVEAARMPNLCAEEEDHKATNAKHHPLATDRIIKQPPPYVRS